MMAADSERGQYLAQEAEAPDNKESAALVARSLALASTALQAACRTDPVRSSLLRKATLTAAKQAELERRFDDADRLALAALGDASRFAALEPSTDVCRNLVASAGIPVCHVAATARPAGACSHRARSL